MDIDKIWCEDCISGMDRIPDGSVDMVLTDPPYCVGVSLNGVKSSWSDHSLIKPFFQKLFEDFERVMKAGASVFVHTDWRTYPILYPLFTDVFLMRNLIVWDYEYFNGQ